MIFRPVVLILFYNQGGNMSKMEDSKHKLAALKTRGLRVGCTVHVGKEKAKVKEICDHHVVVEITEAHSMRFRTVSPYDIKFGV